MPSLANAWRTAASAESERLAASGIFSHRAPRRRRRPGRDRRSRGWNGSLAVSGGRRVWHAGVEDYRFRSPRRRLDGLTARPHSTAKRPRRSRGRTSNVHSSRDRGLRAKRPVYQGAGGSGLARPAAVSSRSNGHVIGRSELITFRNLAMVCGMVVRLERSLGVRGRPPVLEPRVSMCLESIPALLMDDPPCLAMGAPVNNALPRGLSRSPMQQPSFLAVSIGAPSTRVVGTGATGVLCRASDGTHPSDRPRG